MRMDKIIQPQEPASQDHRFISTKKLVIENLELATVASSEVMRSYYEGMP